MSDEENNPVEPRSGAASQGEPTPPPVATPDFSRPPQVGQYYQPHEPGQPGAVDRIIPTRNVKALLAYYFGVFGLVPCFSPFLAPAAIVLGILGLKECSRDPNLPGRGHAITGIVLGSIMLVLVLAVVGFALAAQAQSRRG
jgi:hypothetical protein